MTSLKIVATSPLALIGYVVVVGAWLIRAFLVYRPQARAKDILGQYKSDKERTVALRTLVGSEPPPGLPDKQILEWVKLQARYQNKQLVIAAYLATLVLVATLVGIAINQSIDRSEPRLIRSTPEAQ